MKTFFTLCCFLATAFFLPCLSAGEWHADFEKAKAESQKTGRPIYILFTNANAACLGYERSVFSQKKFQDYADKKLVLMKADFSIATRSRQSRSIIDQNEKLKSEFGVTVFPKAFLLNANGELFIDFVKADGSMEKHNRKIHEIMDFESPKRYAEYLDGFVKKYEPPKVIAPKKTEAKPETKKPAKKPKKPAEKKTVEEPKDNGETTIPNENGGSILIPLDPEGNFEDWLKANTAEEPAAKEATEAAETKKAAAEAETEQQQTSAPAAEDVSEKEAAETATTKETPVEAEAEQEAPAPAAN